MNERFPSKQVLTHLEERQHRLVTVESCTGGMICAALTDIAGSSSVVEGGLMTYSNTLKMLLADVPEDVLSSFGAVSEETAAAMARGALLRLRTATVSLSVTGIAGPDGARPGKPVGTVCFGLALADGFIRTERCLFSGARNEIRQASTSHAMKMLLSL